MKEWVEIRARGPALHSDTVAYELLRAGSPGVVEGGLDPQDTPGAPCRADGEEGGAGALLLVSPDSEDFYNDTAQPTETALLTGHLDPGEAGAGTIEVRLSELADSLGRLGWSLEPVKYKDRDWSKSWRRALRPVTVSNGGTTLVVRATWSRRKRRAGETELLVDPSMAFGTGHHATTKLCLKVLLKVLKEYGKEARNKNLLDVGTGTGVLAIAAVKLGIGSATGVEIDPVSLKIARRTVRANAVSVTISGRAVELQRGLYSIVVANILSGELIRLAPVLAGRLAPLGTLLLSGILGTEANGVVTVYKKLGLRFEKQYNSGEWVALEFEKEA